MASPKWPLSNNQPQEMKQQALKIDEGKTFQMKRTSSKALSWKHAGVLEEQGEGQVSWRSEQELEKGTRSERWSLWKQDLKTQTIFKALALTWIDMGSLRALSRGYLIFLKNERLIWFIYWVCVLGGMGGSQMKRQQTFRMSSKWSWWLGPVWYEWRWKRVVRS